MGNPIVASGVGVTQGVPPGRAAIGAAERVGYAGLFLVLASVVLLSSRGLFTPDIKPEVYLNPLRRLAYDLSAWQPDPQLGVGNYNNGLAPVSAVTSMLHGLGISPELTARLLRLTLLSLGAWGAVRLYRSVAPAADVPSGRLAMAAVFLFNPYAVVGGATLAVLLPYCLFPWQLVALLKALQSGRGWRWPAVFALTFFGMSGMNVAAVPVLQLVSVPAIVVHVRLTTGQSWARLVGVVGRCLLLSVLVSAYWLVPAVAAYGWGSTVASNSETVEGISAPSSFAEVLRGLGLWPMYGRNVVTGPWTPGFTSYLANLGVVAASFALVAVATIGARLSRSRARVLAVLMLASVAVVMVGAHPPGNPSPFGRLLAWVFETVPGAVALRTTNKAGAGLALAVALLVALGMVSALRRLSTHGQQVAAVTCVGAVVVGAAWPALSGQLYVGRWQVPSYWTTATGDLDADRSDSRVWFLPGQVLAHYRWNTEGPDDVNLSLLDRPSLLRTVLPVTSAETTNLLAGIDSSLQEGRLGGRTLSVMARYLGVDQVLLRNDTVWEDARGGRPAVIQPQVDSDPGLRLAATYGAPGLNTATLLPDVDPAADAYENLVEPLRRYDVLDARGIVRAETARGMVLVDGDGFSIPALVSTGLLADSQTFRYLGDMSPDALAPLLGPDRRIVLTDSNRRRAADEHHLTDAYGPLVTPASSPPSTRALFDADAQTVARYEGVADVTATAFGNPFDVSARGAPELAVDGDLSTAWTFGAFGTAEEQTLTVALEGPRDLGMVTVRTGPQPGPVRITALRLRAGEESLVTDVDVNGVARFSLAGVEADSLTVQVAKTSGDGFNLVGVAEVEIPGVEVTKVARMPLGLERLVTELDDEQRAALAATPLDVVMQRERGSQPDADEERTLARDFATPDARSFRLYGIVRGDRTMAGLPAEDAEGCVTVATLDGAPVRVRLLEEDVDDARGSLVEGCSPVRLSAGTHELRPVEPWAADVLVLRDLRGDSVRLPGAVPSVRVTDRTNTSLEVSADAADTPYLLVLGQSLDPRWRASMDGAPMGAPILVDGHSAAWEVTRPGPHTFSFSYTPQRIVDATRLASLAVLCLLGYLALRGRPEVVADPSPGRRRAWRPPAGRRRAAESVVILAGCLVAGGPAMTPVGVALAAAHWSGRPRPGTLISASAALFALVPVAWVIGNADQWGEITPNLVVDTPLPGWLAASALAALVVGVLDDERRLMAGPRVRRGEGA